MATDTDVLIIGAGMSGLDLAVQLIRKHGPRNFEMVEKTNNIGGTWHINSYPGCGCDVPSHFYCYSFALNPNWSQKFALQPEIQQYFDNVAQQYGIIPHVRFHTELKTADWDPVTASWVVRLHNCETKESYSKRCKVLVSAVGGLSAPNGCDVPGADSFKGRLFHSAKWDHTFDYKEKEVICIGNGCSATQFVPVVSAGPGKVKKITQFSRQAHWLSERPNPKYSDTFKWLMRYIPGAMRVYRWFLFLMQEKDFAGYIVQTGERLRKDWTQTTTEYIRANAPEKYRDVLVPKSTIGCKRRVMDTDYLASLHRENVELIHDDPIAAITETGVRTNSGREVNADAIVLANGFSTQAPMFPMMIRGENGVSVQQHWQEMTDGAPEAYFGTCLSGFPNFFIMMGPNTLSGHLSVMFTTECQINFTLKTMGPILKSLHPPLWASWTNYQYPDSVVVRSQAERADVEWANEKAKKLVWATGCTSWFIDTKTGRNTVMYPDWQSKLWLRSVFVPWRDFVYRKSESVREKESHLPTVVGLASALALTGGVLLVTRTLDSDHFKVGVGGLSKDISRLASR